MASVKLTGLDDLKRKLRELPKRVETRVVKVALKKGGEIIRDAAISRAPEDSGLLKKNIVYRALSAKKGQVGVRKQAQKHVDNPQNRRMRRVGKRYYSDGPAFYGRFVEFGTKNMAAHPFMRPAFDATAPAAIDAIGKALLEGIDQEVRKL
ncbi:HK97-gp10 family putative phage morphogenesis protein [Silvimonas soli]|uniref:HK97-gp10 family putative phage morphogenesis protein n=1 Tax=Silvimonas soli TaxID=2980100 RepID=UPI0024B370D8|nr:HK97-gp10 family putative phage morphogenesis protein [Silvimonas soli]